MSTAIEQIKSLVTCVQVAQQCGLPISKAGDRCASFLHAGDNPMSVLIQNDYFYSFSDGIGGDCIDLLALHDYDGDKGKAIHELAKITGVVLNSKHTEQWQKYTQHLIDRCVVWHKNMLDNHPEIIDYLAKRKINADTISKLKIGYNSQTHRIIIPMWKNGYICYYIGRTTLPVDKKTNPKYLKPRLDDYNENDIHGLLSLEKPKYPDTLIIAEGAFDYLSFYQEGYPVIATCGGNFNKTQLKRVISICKQFKSVLLTFDNDTSGNKFTVSMAKTLFKNNIKFTVSKIPKKYKDISEYYEDNGDLSEIISNTDNGIVSLCSMFKDRDDFENFIRSSSRFLKKTEIIEIFNTVIASNSYGNTTMEWYKTLKSECSKLPNDGFLAKTVLSKHTLMYLSSTGFYEYENTHWVRKTDEEIKSYIISEGVQLNNKKHAVFGMLQTMSPPVPPMNRKAIMNFINGTLELETNTFRQHSQYDYVDYVLNYPYNPDAFYSEWDKFIISICDDPKKEALLQELAGYILFPTNSLQMSAFLVGDGSNGKSVFLNVLQRVISPENVSNVQLTSFNKPFEVINMLNSMVNISTEVKTDVESCESMFKMITAGDNIQACYKGKDYITFTPRSKLFFACNELPRINDKSKGFIRRMCIVNFPYSFVEYPKLPHERKIDKQLEEKFAQPHLLSSIFNWMYDGYRLLQTKKSFTETDDQQEIKSNFEKTNNPYIVFVEEFDFPSCGIKASDLWMEYKVWCENNEYKPGTSRSFYTWAKDNVNKYRNDVEFVLKKTGSWYVVVQ